jgi:hypothetical protein
LTKKKKNGTISTFFILMQDRSWQTSYRQPKNAHKKSENSRFMGINDAAYAAGPLSDAFLDIPEGFDDVRGWVRQKNKTDANGESEPRHLDVYIGKMRLSFGDRIRRFLGYRPTNTFKYSPDFVERVGEFHAENKGDFPSLRIIRARRLSELFNGTKDVAECISDRAQARIIKSLDASGEIKTEAIESMPEHQELFGRLEKSLDEETGTVDLHRAYAAETIELSSPPTSLQIAQLLYKAAFTDNVKNNLLRKLLLKTVPERLVRDLSPEESVQRSGYGLTEVAIRLAEAINGNSAQGGVDRQRKYDDIINGLIQGQKGPFKHYETLKLLFTFTEGKRFETVHFDTDANPAVVRNVRKGTRRRIAALGMAGLTALTGVWQGARAFERAVHEGRVEVVDAVIDEELHDVGFYKSYDNPWSFNSIMENRKIFDGLVSQIQMQLQARYELDEDLIEGIKPLIQGELLRQKDRLAEINISLAEKEAFTDRFVKKFDIYLRINGADTGRPYPRLEAYKEEMKKLADAENPSSFTVLDFRRDSGRAGFAGSGHNLILHHQAGQTRFFGENGKIVSEFNIENEYKKSNNFHLRYIGSYLYQESELGRLKVVSDEKGGFFQIFAAANADPFFGSNVKYDTFEAKKIARDYVASMRRYDALQVEYELDEVLWDLCQNPERYAPDLEECTYNVETNCAMVEGPCNLHIYRYTDTFGEFDYKIWLSHRPSPIDGKWIPHPLAIKMGERMYTTKRAKEAAAHYCDAVEPLKKEVHDLEWSYRQSYKMLEADNAKRASGSPSRTAQKSPSASDKSEDG